MTKQTIGQKQDKEPMTNSQDEGAQTQSANDDRNSPDELSTYENSC